MLLQCRVTHLVGKNLPLTLSPQFWQLVGRYCSYLHAAYTGWQDIPKLSQWEREVFTNDMNYPVFQGTCQSCWLQQCAITWFIVEEGEDAAVLIVNAAPSPPMLAFLPILKQQ